MKKLKYLQYLALAALAVIATGISSASSPSTLIDDGYSSGAVIDHSPSVSGAGNGIATPEGGTDVSGRFTPTRVVDISDSASTSGFRIGDTLITAIHGVHKSIGQGTYKGGGVYVITMKDGGRARTFPMRFKLIARGGGNYTFDRLDCGDPDDQLTDKGNGVLQGGPITLNFR